MAIEQGWVTERRRVEGRSVHIRRSVGGSGVPVVHIHGFAISGAYLMPTARVLAPGRSQDGCSRRGRPSRRRGPHPATAATATRAERWTRNGNEFG